VNLALPDFRRCPGSLDCEIRRTRIKRIWISAGMDPPEGWDKFEIDLEAGKELSRKGLSKHRER
jgi:hypothetical protein